MIDTLYIAPILAVLLVLAVIFALHERRDRVNMEHMLWRERRLHNINSGRPTIAFDSQELEDRLRANEAFRKRSLTNMEPTDKRSV